MQRHTGLQTRTISRQNARSALAQVRHQHCVDCQGATQQKREKKDLHYKFFNRRHFLTVSLVTWRMLLLFAKLQSFQLFRVGFLEDGVEQQTLQHQWGSQASHQKRHDEHGQRRHHQGLLQLPVKPGESSGLDGEHIDWILHFIYLPDCVKFHWNKLICYMNHTLDMYVYLRYRVVSLDY